MSSEYLGEFMPISFILDLPEASERQLFVKKHEANSEAKPSDRTLFVLNVPQFLKKKSIKLLFKHCGEVERVYYHSKPKSTEDEKMFSVFDAPKKNNGFKVAYIVFKTSEGLKNALKTKELPSVSYKETTSLCGLRKWAKEYNSSFIDVDAVQKEIDCFMAEYDAKVKEKKRKAKESEAVADEDGWITITKHSKKSNISRNEVVSEKLILKHKREEAKKTLLNFYRCQLRQSKMEHLLELRKKFEKDKERIAQMKANRKFKPF